MADALHDLTPAVAALAGWLDTNLPSNAAVHLRRVPADAQAPFAVLAEAPGHGDTSGPPMAGDQLVDLVVDVTSVGVTDDQALALAGRVHAVMVGRAGDGGFTVPVVLPGLVVIDRSCESRSGLRVDVPLPQCVDTYRLQATRA